MNDEKIEHLRQLAIKRQLKFQQLRKQRGANAQIKHATPSDDTTNDGEADATDVSHDGAKSNSSNSTSVNENAADVLDVIKNHSGIPFILSIFQKNVGFFFRNVDLNINSKYNIIEENVINLFEVSSFVLNYFFVSDKKSQRFWGYRLLKIIDKFIVLLRFKILIWKIFKFLKLQRILRRQKSGQIDNTIKIIKDENGQRLAIEDGGAALVKEQAQITLDAGDKEQAKENTTVFANSTVEAVATAGGDSSETHVAELKDTTSELQNFEVAWKDSTEKILGSTETKGQLAIIKDTQVIASEENNVNGDSSESISSDIVSLTEFKSIEDQISGLKTEILVEFVDFVLLLYPKSITGMIYDKLFSKRNN